MDAATELYFEQGTPEWLAAREGRITASCFHYVMGSPKAQRSYLALIRGLKAGAPSGMRSLEHGKRYEPAAIADFEFTTDHEVRHVGLLIHPEMPEVAASPDGLIDPDGGVEIKCPSNPEIHTATVFRGAMPTKHVPQVQGNMYVSGRAWWYFMSFDPRAPLARRRFLTKIWRDEPYIRKLDQRVRAFREHLLNGTEPQDQDITTAAIPFL